MSDRVIEFGESIIQHGKENDRVYLMKLSKNDLPNIIEYVDGLIDKYGYTKVFAKVPSFAFGHFEKENYQKEAFVPKFFNNTEDCCFLGKFLAEQRKKERDESKVQIIIDTATNKKPRMSKLPMVYSIKKMTKLNVDDMAVCTKKYLKPIRFQYIKGNI